MSPNHREKRLPILDFRKWTVRMAVAAGFAVTLLLLAAPRGHPCLLASGGVLVGLGLAVRIWGTGHLVKNKVLATGGPYAFVRHPLYLGTFFVVLGLGLMGASRWVLIGLLPATMLIFLLYYAPRKERVESDRLRRRFGEEFEKYRSEVRGYFPRMTPYPGRQGRWSFGGVLENREYLITLAVLLGMAVILGKL